MNLNEIAVFVKVVETGSFTSAARSLDMPKSTVSARLSSLEERLGVTLIRRTTRKLHITDAGRAYYEKCQEAILKISEAEEQVTQSQSAPSGLLRITAPVELGGCLLPHVIDEFNSIYPKVHLEVILTDRTVDLVSDGIDIGIRVGQLKDSSLISKKLGMIYFAPFASPKYLKKNGEIKSPKDLENQQIIPFAPLSTNEWTLVGNKEKKTIKITKKTLINDLNLIKNLTCMGQGVSLMPTFLCYNEVKTGRLIRILPNWRTELRPVHFVYPSQKFVSPKIRGFIEVASKIIKEQLEIAEF